jgi:hypothetical protein
VTTNGTKPKKTGKRNPLVALKPLVVLATAEHGLDIVLDTDGITRPQRDAAIAFLNQELDSSSFKLKESGSGGRYVLHGAVAAYTGDQEFYERYLKVVQPKFPNVGTLTMDAARLGRKLMGVECVVTATARSALRTPELPVLANKPAGVLELEHEGSAVAFTVCEPDRPDDQLIVDAVAVAAAFGVYIEKPPLRVNDPDRRARLYSELRHTAASG